MRLQRHGNIHTTLRTDLDPENVETAVIRRAFPDGLTEAERRATGKRLLKLGYSTRHIARLSGASTRTVERWKAALAA
ncbi:helix-turn-helix domain-containing protein [Streptomyces sp. A0592]|uniref:helix-turn-helix domain-containing protein n=1 Tax=Streptomyces sp. A0592 TaxID=2563099 RepID=UPI0019D0A807|nr:helix-turn-helix domain-containing protein [Streptomyces sp. A0592]